MMKRLAIITVGKTHSGKTTFARALENKLDNSFVMDQDNQAEFIHDYYKKLLPKQGPNKLKYALTRQIVAYAKEHTDLHFIISNSNRGKEGRFYLLEEVFPKGEFIRILVHFDIPDQVLQARVGQSQRSTNILRVAANFEEVLIRQQADSLKEDVADPIEGEADYLFVIKNNEEIQSIIQRIVYIARCL